MAARPTNEMITKVLADICDYLKEVLPDSRTDPSTCGHEFTIHIRDGYIHLIDVEHVASALPSEDVNEPAEKLIKRFTEHITRALTPRLVPNYHGKIFASITKSYGELLISTRISQQLKYRWDART